MIDPFSFWRRMMSAGVETARTNMRTVEMLVASGDVIERRSEIIGAAIARPLRADTAELSRMVPEKAEAFSQMGLGIMADYWAAQSAWMAECRNLSAFMLRGRAPTAGEMIAMTSRSMTFAAGSAERAVQSRNKALAPIHKSATANAKRLARRARTED